MTHPSQSQCPTLSESPSSVLASPASPPPESSAAKVSTSSCSRKATTSEARGATTRGSIPILSARIRTGKWCTRASTTPSAPTCRGSLWAFSTTHFRPVRMGTPGLFRVTRRCCGFWTGSPTSSSFAGWPGSGARWFG